MKKRVLTTLMVVTVVGAALTGCGASQSAQGDNIQPVAVQTMAKSTEGVATKVTENVVIDETKVDEKETMVTETKENVESTGENKQAVTTTEEKKESVAAEKKSEETKQNASDETENTDVDEEPYFGEIGNIDNLKVTLGNSDLYTKEELQSAVGYILGKFQVDFTDCVMTELDYDEAFSLSQCQVWADQYDADEAIVFTCTFNTTENYQELVMEPGQVCEGYNWILTRNEGEDWTLQTWGY